MSRLTNKLGLPRSIENAVRNDPYSKGDADISVTGLIAPARIRQLYLRHYDEVTEDVADRIWSLLGQVTHGILERADDQALTERRLYIERHGWRISGQYDRLILEGGVLQDYKLTSTYSVKEGPKPEWEAQINLYAHLLRCQPIPQAVNRLQDVVILRDWQRAKAQHSPDYPQQGVVVLDAPLWPPAQCEAFILQRLLVHGHAQHRLPECAPEERWEKPADFALFKSGNQRATSRHPSLEAARTALEERQAKAKKNEVYAIETRPAEQTRCLHYCPVAPFCEQWAALNTHQSLKAAMGRAYLPPTAS